MGDNPLFLGIFAQIVLTTFWPWFWLELWPIWGTTTIRAKLYHSGLMRYFTMAKLNQALEPADHYPIYNRRIG